MSKVEVEMKNKADDDDDISVQDIKDTRASSDAQTRDRFQNKKKTKTSKYDQMTTEERHHLISDFRPIEIKDFPKRPFKTICIVS